ncbi:MAG: hypothetical protein K9H49_12950 [Bacteroidales bacterium]|nr:hypothetical protein [Bacteroidales bacterium]MCF8390403.1 hypothetical protein [Bacteroidales bacterium]
MNTYTNFEYEEIPQNELTRFHGGVFLPIGISGGIILKIISILFPNEII